MSPSPSVSTPHRRPGSGGPPRGGGRRDPGPWSRADGPAAAASAQLPQRRRDSIAEDLEVVDRGVGIDGHDEPAGA
ncbi:MAG: hypothetical protein ACRCYU_21730 [Nocardioides sp.]